MDANTYRFTLFLSGATDLDEAICNKLFEAGCSDGTPALISGDFQIQFDREAASLSRAIYTACEDVRKAGLDVIRVNYE